MSNVKVLEDGGAFGKWLGYTGGALVSGLNVLVRDPTELPSPFHQAKTQK